MQLLEIIPITVELTRSHLGYFEFRLCAEDAIRAHLSQSCYDQHLLQLADRSGTQYPIQNGSGYYQLKLKLPNRVHCRKCVIQWHYRTGV